KERAAHALQRVRAVGRAGAARPGVTGSGAEDSTGRTSGGRGAWRVYGAERGGFAGLLQPALGGRLGRRRPARHSHRRIHGLPDLLVSAGGGSIYVFRNVGTAHQPKWALNHDSLTTTWGFVRSYSMVGSAADLRGDGRIETISGDQFFACSGPAYSPKTQAS